MKGFLYEPKVLKPGVDVEWIVAVEINVAYRFKFRFQKFVVCDDWDSKPLRDAIFPSYAGA